MKRFVYLKPAYKKAVAVIASYLLFIHSYAVTEVAKDSISSPTLNGSSVFTVVDPKYSTMQSNSSWPDLFYNKKIKNRVILKIDQKTNVFQATEYNVIVRLLITYKTWNGTAFQTNTAVKNLMIEYNKYNEYTEKNAYEFEGGNELKVEVTSITTNPSMPLSQLNVTLLGEIEVERYYTFDPEFVPSVSHASTNLASRGELDIFWPAITGAEEYDLEWTFINNYTGSSLDVDTRLFQFNSTRISTTATSYKIPYIYEKGYILYRVRGIGRTALDGYLNPLAGRWSSYPDNFTSVSTFPTKFPAGAEAFISHQDHLNWQFSATYAEEGKSKEVVNYFDGSLRNRQSVTKMKSDDQIVIGESIYDHQGRPTIQVLPVPVPNPKIAFNLNFNRNEANIPYTKADFDIDGLSCDDITPEPMDTATSGAARYYSGANTDTRGSQEFLPNAQQYPFTQTAFTPDNTGKIRAQSGVGKYFQLGSKHETQYFYGTPHQEELDRLFGSEAGNAIHYKKNMVRDANGQLSVSYLDPSDRVIATSLTGTSPSNVRKIGSNFEPSDMSIDLLNKIIPTDLQGLNSQLNLAERTLSVSKEITVGSEGIRDFIYNLHGAKFEEACTVPVTYQVCYDCVLDLKISLTDACNNGYLTGAGASDNGTAVPAVTIGQNIIDAIRASTPQDPYNPVNCSSPALEFEKGVGSAWQTTTAGTPAPLKVGKYSLNKVLTVNQEALDFYTKNYLESNACIQTYENFLEKEIAAVDLSGCDMTCEQCATKLGTFEQYNIAQTPGCDPCLTKAEYDELLAQCYESCDEKSIKCDAAKQNMLADVSPMGQYGQIAAGGVVVDGEIIEPEITTMDASVYPLSVYNDGNQLPRKQAYHDQYVSYAGDKNGGWAPSWRFPLNLGQFEEKRFTYLDENDNIAYIELAYTNGIYTPAVVDENLVKHIDNRHFICPQFLANYQDFVQAWESEWANSLVCYHPEYGYYEFCTSISSSHDFDDTWLELDKISNVLSKWGGTNIMHPVPDPDSSPSYPGIDPYFTSANPNYTTEERDAMLNAMKNYSGGKSIWELTYITVYSPNASDLMNCQLATMPNGYVFQTDAEWNTYKSLYISLKQRFQQQAATKYAIAHGCYNGCIGADQFDAFKNGFFQKTNPISIWNGYPYNFPYFPSQFGNFEQPCNWARRDLYKEKQSRFPGISDMIEVKALNHELCYPPYNPDLDYDPETKFSVVSCPEKDAEILNEAKNLTELSLYEQCGKCPNAQYLELFLNALVINPAGSELLHTDISLGCYPEIGTYPEFTDNLAKALNFETFAGEIFYNYLSGLSTPYSEFVASFTETAQNCELRLKFPAGNTLYDFGDIENLCCLKHIPDEPNEDFEIKARVKLKPGDPDYDALEPGRTREIILEGTSCIDVGGCTFDPICKATKVGVQLQNLFNALLFKNEENEPEFTSMNEVPLSPNPRYSPFVDPIRKEIDAAIDPYPNPEASWAWETDMVNPGLRTMTAHIAYQWSPTPKCEFTFVMPLTMLGYTFDDIKSFNGLRRDTTAGKTDHDFLMTALVSKKTLDNKTHTEYITVKGNSACFNMIECTDKVPSSFVLGNTKTTYTGAGLQECTLTPAGISVLNIMNEELPVEQDDSLHVFGMSTECPFSISFPVGTVYQTDDIDSVTDMTPNPDFAKPGEQNNYFIVVAHLKNGVLIPAKGYYSCSSIGSCEEPPHCPVTGPNLTANSNFENDENGFSSSYEFMEPNSHSSTPGTYSVIKDGATYIPCCFQGKDHSTGDGKFIAINTTSVANTWIWGQDDLPVKPNTDYRFSMWVSTLYIQNSEPVDPPAKLKFSINGVQIGAIVNAPEVQNKWIYAEVVWNSGVNSTADLKIINTAADGAIHFLGLDDIKFRPCGATSVMCDITSILLPPVTVDTTACIKELINLATTSAQIQYETYVKNIKKQFQEAYIKKCLNVYEDFFMKYKDNEHHFTLYYYDQAGNLLRTVPPEGVVKVTDPQNGDSPTRVAEDMAHIKLDRANNTHTYFTKHTYATTYKYNSLNQLVAQSTPDNENLNIWNPSPASTGIPDDHKITNTVFSDGLKGTAFTIDAAGVGHMYITMNGGTSWSEVTNIGTKNLNDVQMIDQNIAYAIGQDGLVLKTTDGGTNWIISPSPSLGELKKLLFTDALNGKVFEKDGTSWETIDGATSWINPLTSLKTALGTATLEDVSIFYNNTATALASTGKIYRTADAGISWAPVTSIQSVGQNKVVSIGNNRLTFGRDGTILKSTDGIAWKEIANNLTYDLIDGYFSSPTNGWVIEDYGGFGLYGTIQKTINGGTVWTTPEMAYGNYKQLFFYNSINGYALTENGDVAKSDGVNWSQNFLGSANTGPVKMNTIFIVSPSLANGVGFMGGDEGTLYKTENGGTTWSLLTGAIPVTEDIVKMHYNTNGKGSILTRSGKLYYTTNGTTYTEVLNTANVYSDVQFVSTTNGYALSENGIIAATTNEGANWTEATTSVYTTTNSNKLKSICMQPDGLQGVVTGEQGELWTTTDGGATAWVERTKAIQIPPLHSIIKYGRVGAMAVGDDGTVIITLDNGLSWKVEITGISANLYDWANGSRSSAVGQGGANIQTTDLTNWTPYNSASDDDMKSVVYSTTLSAAIAVGNNSTALILPAAETYWDKMTTLNSTDALNSVAENTGIVIAVGEKGKILKYDGSNWTQQNRLIPPVLNDAAMSDLLNGTAVGNNGSILVTADGGASWKIQNSGTLHHLNSIYIFPGAGSSKAIAVGDSGTVIMRQANTTVWTPLTGFGITKLNDIHISDQLGIIVGENGIAYRSTNGGTTWAAVTPTNTTEHLNAIHITDKTSAYAVGNQGVIIRIKDNGADWTSLVQTPSGQNWVQYLSGATQHLNDVYFKDYLTGYAVGNNGIMLKTFTGGASWVLENLNDPDPLSTSDYTDLSVIDNNNIFISGTSGNVTHLTDMKDEFASIFKYDKLGRLVVSQNAKQFNKTTSHLTYSYTRYDALGRIAEVGEIAAQAGTGTGQGPIEKQYTGPTLDDVKFAAWLANGTKTEVTSTFYDTPKYLGSFPVFVQQNLRKRVSATYLDNDGNSANGYNHATFYSYDIHGNVKSILQENPQLYGVDGNGNPYRRIDYDYDLISGNVKQISYQKGEIDAFYHKYYYDQDNRLKDVYTSKDKVIWDRDANYSYYQHGPLARTELGELKVQGIDYAYTLQGWIKGVNSTNLNPVNDIGQDGYQASGNPNSNVAPDVFSYSLNYFRNDPATAGENERDYTSIGGNNNFIASIQNAAYTAPNLYNGNISSMATTITNISQNPSPQLSAYRYDQLNRIKEVKTYRDASALSGNDWATATTDDSYYSVISYDANGNIRTMKANGNAANGFGMDDLTYKYENIANGYTRNTNKLRSVEDAATSTYTDDIKNQAANNYEYDEIGNLIHDASEQIETIEWTVYGKIKSVTRTAGSVKADLEFTYDAQGNRVSKIVKPKLPDGSLAHVYDWIITMYVNDASGNTLATYIEKYDPNNGLLNVYLQDFSIYGSSRLGTKILNLDILFSSNPPGLYQLGSKRFELSNHLGNVLTVITDQREAIDNSGTIGSYKARVASTTDYYAFGAPMPGRTLNNGYRYGFNGQEKDDEISGNGNELAFKFREYDARLGRFFTIDPLTDKFPYWTPYQFAGNTPIEARELEGLETWHTTTGSTETDISGTDMKRSSSGPLEPGNAIDMGYASYTVGQTYNPSEKGSLKSSEQNANFIKSEEGLRLNMYDNDGGKQGYSYQFLQTDPKDPKKKTTETGTACCGNVTIGYGHLIHYGPLVPSVAINKEDLKTAESPFLGGITQEAANTLLSNDISGIEKTLRSNLTAPITQEQFDALVSFGFNAGPGNAGKALRKLNAGDIQGASNFIRNYQNIPARRNKEANIFDTQHKFNISRDNSGKIITR